ncbi:MAG: alpha/beta hydrolase, partial [Actinobacteria bacterium]|nr:alpha/beta hydrolase [Actinomycetota bacterium]
AGDAVAVLDAARVESAHVVGASLGGMIAQELAISHPERVDRLVLVCTTPGGLASHSVPQAALDLMYEAPELEPDEALRRSVEIGLGPGVADARPDLVEKIVELRNANAFDLAGWWAQAMAGASFDAYDRLDRIDSPTLVVTGTGDTVVDCRNSELLTELIPGARLELFPGCGHLLFWEEPERFAATVASFLSDRRANGARVRARS